MKTRQIHTCHSCRARRLGCDGKKPACSQCLFSKRQCPGYQYDLIFVPYRHLSSGPSANAAARNARVGSENRSSTDTSRNSGHHGRLLTSGERNVRSDYYALPPSLFPRQPLLEESSTLIVREYTPWFTESSICSGQDMSPPQICGSWVSVLSNLVGSSDLDGVLHAAMGALGLAIREREASMCKQVPVYGRAYGNALSLLRSTLLRACFSCRNCLVAASMCLSISELMTPTSKDGWIMHLRGLTTVLQLSGPESHRAGVPHLLFIGAQPLLLFEAIHSQKPFFLASDEWRTDPFLLHPPTHLQDLTNHAAGIPSLLEKFDILMESPSSGGSTTARHIWSKFSRTLDTLESWEQQYQLDTSRPLYWAEPSPMADNWHSTSVHEPGSRVWFQNIIIANALTYLWALRIICITHKERIESRFPTTSRNASAMEMEPPVQTNQSSTLELSVRICQSMEYLLQGEMGLYGPFISLFPFKVAQQTLKMQLSREDQRYWCQGIVDRFTSTGFDVGSFDFKV
ncbi:hypothetical protein F5884DRAFT_712250 [Xylogone sp. PMI_703]|nr:hypothetical protein F5884DRAFT_712250 [Xylogone sp. PMI_703]